MRYLKQYPTPIAGLALGIAGIAAYWSSIVNDIKLSHAILIIAALLVCLLLFPLVIRFITYPRKLLDDLRHPTVGSVVPTFAMSLMLLSHTLGLYSANLAMILWLIAVLLHMSFFVVFCYFRIKDLNLNHLLPSWFVPPIGIVVACLTVPSADFLMLSHILLVFGIIMYAVMLPLVLYRLSFGEKIENARKPTLAILAAPASLTLAGYLSLVQHSNPLLVISLFAIAVLMTVSVYMMFLHLLRLKFSPAFSAFTFPLAISATASFKMSIWVMQYPLLKDYANSLFVFSSIEGVIATVIIAYVFIHYLFFLPKCLHQSAEIP